MPNLNVCYVGDTGILQKDNIELMFRNMQYPIHFWDTWRKLTVKNKKRVNYFTEFHYYYNQLNGVSDEFYRKELVTFFDKNKIDCVMAYWGTNVFADIITIKRYFPKIKIVLNVLCHPMGMTMDKISLQNLFFRLSLRHIDGIIYSSNVMKDYFKKHIVLKRALKSLVMPPYWSRNFFSSALTASKESRPNIIFLGRGDWWNGDPTDNLEQTLKQLSTNKIHVYYSSNDLLTWDPAYAHPFRPVPLGVMKNFGNQFDATFVGYNLTCCKDDTRFRTTVPDRLMAGIAMGLPIAIARDGYDASKEFLRDWPGVIEFDSISQLCNKLNDTACINDMKERCYYKMPEYFAENYFTALMSFLDTL